MESYLSIHQFLGSLTAWLAQPDTIDNNNTKSKQLTLIKFCITPDVKKNRKDIQPYQFQWLHAPAQMSMQQRMQGALITNIILLQRS